VTVGCACKANALLEINHSIHQKAYVDWKFSRLSTLVRTPPQQRAGNGGRVAYRFVTRSLPELTPYYRAFYGPGGKGVPEVELRSLALAVWFMDDGCRSRRAVYLNTQQFALADQLRLVGMLRDQWHLDATLNRDKIYYRLRLSVESTARFVQIIGGHLLPMFNYKLPQVTP
jgi:hypothetical protein